MAYYFIINFWYHLIFILPYLTAMPNPPGRWQPWTSILLLLLFVHDQRDRLLLLFINSCASTPKWVMPYSFFRGANLLAVNADGNMPYDICEDDATLDYIEGEMASRGVTQSLIDETRSATETHMLNHLKMMKSKGQSLMFRDQQGATPVSITWSSTKWWLGG